MLRLETCLLIGLGKLMIPDNIEVEHVLKAVDQIDRERVPSSRRSVYYDLIKDGKPYPPKYIISIANEYANGRHHPPGRFNAVEAKNYLAREKFRQEFQVIDRREVGNITIATEDDESAYPEGKERYRQHRSYERDPNLARKAKTNRINSTGKLQCDVCSFDFSVRYGELGEGFIEAHHTVPVANLCGKRKTKLSEIALVCSNCHRMLHRGQTLLSIEELTRIIARNSTD